MFSNLCVFHWSGWSPLDVIGITGLLCWSVWALRVLFSDRIVQYMAPCHATVSVVMPAYRETMFTLSRCIRTVLANSPHEIIVVFNGPENDELAKRIHYRFAGQVQIIRINQADKRMAMTAGIRAATSDIVALVDSDVAWSKNTLVELIRPFNDPEIGGTCAGQIINNEDATIWTRVQGMISACFNTSLGFQNVDKCVSCLRGRTAAYRRSLLLKVLPDFENEGFLGTRCVSGDDGCLTFLALREGYQTYYCKEAIISCEVLETFQGFMKNRLRIARNSNRRFFKAMFSRWFWTKSWRLQMALVTTVIFPLFIALPVIALSDAVYHGELCGVIATVGWLSAGRVIRRPAHYLPSLQRVAWLPLVILVWIFPMLFIRVYALGTLRHQGWLTR